MVADLTIQPGEDNPQRFGGKVFNVSKSGLAVFSKHAFPPGKLTGIEMILPLEGEGVRRVTLFGVTRWMRVEPDGNLLGIELLADHKAGDYDWFARHLDKLAATARPAFTLVETCIAMVIVCLMVTLAAPTFRQAIEQARADSTSANLRTIWSAQRVYWLEYRTFTPNMTALRSLDLVDGAVASSASNPSATYVYQIVSADDRSFTARALRNGSGAWTGQLEIDQEGVVTGAIAGPSGQVVTPTQ
ncbi:MAG TPA: hypothetical protein PK082_01720 [Phycisphaerae bacterium]|nr:hypothetical protein [Phycisphaerae bacterium]